MPTYDYVCRGCDHRFELFQSMTASIKKKCPECGQLKLERLIGTGAGVIFKGSGFYQTDYRSDSYKKSADADKPKPETKKSDSSSKSSSKSDSKSAGRTGDGAAGSSKSSGS